MFWWIVLGILGIAWLAAAGSLLCSHLAVRRIRAWADERGYAVLRVRFRRHLGGVLFWAPFVQRGTWEVEVADDEGGRRTGWVRFGWWWLEIPWGRIHVEWR